MYQLNFSGIIVAITEVKSYTECRQAHTYVYEVFT